MLGQVVGSHATDRPESLDQPDEFERGLFICSLGDVGLGQGKHRLGLIGQVQFVQRHLGGLDVLRRCELLRNGDDRRVALFRRQRLAASLVL